MKIAEVSKRYGISADTLRYYERIGILRDVPRAIPADCEIIPRRIATRLSL